MNLFYFPLVIFIFIFSLIGLFLSRKELGFKYKISTLLISISIFGYFLFSQPLIIEKKGFGIDSENNLYNALVLWDFSNGKSSKLQNEVFVDQNGNEVKLSDFKGKDIYITFWATWCGPCLQEKEVLEQLKSNLKDNENLVFIDISIDKDMNKWNAFLEDHNSTGIQLISKMERKTIANFKLPGVPHHVVVNKDGHFKKFISPHFAKTEILASSDRINEYVNTPYKVFDVKVENGKEIITQVK